MPGPNKFDFSKIKGAKKEQAKEDLTIEALTLLKNELNKLEINSGSSNNVECQPSQNESDLSEADIIETALILRLDLANKGDAVIDGERHHIQLESLALAEKRSKNTFQLLQYSRANTRDVLDAQDDLFDAQNATTDALVDHAIAMLSFYRDVGALQVRPDGMWEL